MFNVGNKTLEEVTTQDAESMDGSSDDDNVNHNSDKSSHTNTRTKKKTAPIVVLGSELQAVQATLLKIVVDKKIVIRITSIGHRIDLIEGDDFIDDMVKADEAIGYHSYPTIGPTKLCYLDSTRWKEMS